MQTSEFRIDDEEWDFYDALTRYVEDQSIKAAADNSPAVGHWASPWPCCSGGLPPVSMPSGAAWNGCAISVQKILDDPEAYRQEQIAKKLPDDFDELPEDEQEDIIDAA